jgi:putative monooxygenase
MSDTTTTRLAVRRADDVRPETRRGGEIRTLLSPRSVGATSGFMGVATIAPGDWIAEHYHPHSEEFIYVVSGKVTAEVGGETADVLAREGLLIPPGARHRVANTGDEEAFLVFHLGPLAPRPELGHVETERRHPGAPE